MNRKLLGSLGWLGLVLVAACGSDDKEDSPTLASYAQAQCEAMQRCYPAGLSRLGGAARCPERAKLFYESTMLPGMNLDAKWLEGCIANVKSAPCEQVLAGEILGCAPPKGTLPEGSACMSDAQCATGACYRVEAPPACGKCAVPVFLGDSCKGAPCAEGLTCSWGGSTPSVCVVDESSELPKAGDACDSSGSYPWCGATLRCLNNVCSERAEPGESCSTVSDCVLSAYCDTTEKVCKTVNFVGEGEACSDPGIDCADGLFCEGNSVCARYVEDGGACEATSSCLTPATCQKGVCALPKPQTCETP